jgi:hypothetical protein
MEEKWEERFDEYFYDADHSLKPSQIAHIKKYLITDLISSAVTQALKEERGETLEEIDIMLAEEPSNYPTPQGQEAVYGVLERLKERLLSNNK